MPEQSSSSTYSYRSDSDVPAFADRFPIAFMDGECGLCCRGAQLISNLDTSGDIRICPVQSDLGRAILAHYKIDPNDPQSWLYLEDGKPHLEFDAITRILLRTGRLRVLANLLSALPRGCKGWLYRRIAANRYLFGRSDICHLRDPALHARLLK